MPRLTNASAVPQAVLSECVIAPGETASVTAGAIKNPGIKSRIDSGDLKVAKTTKKEG